MPSKMIMRWDIRIEKDSEYSEFFVHEFIPGLNKLGVVEIQVWFTQYGDCEQIMASGIANTLADMKKVLDSDEWELLSGRLEEYVKEFSLKIVSATGGFQV